MLRIFKMLLQFLKPQKKINLEYKDEHETPDFRTG